MIPPESEPDIHEACAHWLEYLVRDRRLAVTSVTTYRSAIRLTFVGLSSIASHGQGPGE